MDGNQLVRSFVHVYVLHVCVFVGLFSMIIALQICELDSTIIFYIVLLLSQ